MIGWLRGDGTAIMLSYGVKLGIRPEMAKRRTTCVLCGQDIMAGTPRLTLEAQSPYAQRTANGGFFSKATFRIHPFCMFPGWVEQEKGDEKEGVLRFPCVGCGKTQTARYPPRLPHTAMVSSWCDECHSSLRVGTNVAGYRQCRCCLRVLKANMVAKVDEVDIPSDRRILHMYSRDDQPTWLCRACEKSTDVPTVRSQRTFHRRVMQTLSELRNEFFSEKG